MEQWAQVEAGQKHIIMGFVKDKDIEEALALFPKDNNYHFCNAAIPRALPSQELVMIAKKSGLNGNYYDSVADAVRGARDMMNEGDALLITGSFFVVGEAMEFLESERTTEVSKEELSPNN